MLIDWFTVGAQIVNFLVLIWLLQRYLYRPILAAIDAREKEIVSRRDAALAEQKRAQKDREEFERQKAAMEQQRLALLNEAQEQARAERTRLLQEANGAAEALRTARQKELEEETANYRDELISLARQEIIATVRKILFDLASIELERASVEVFLRRLDAASVLGKAEPSRPEDSLRLRSAFALSAEQQKTMREEIQKKFQTGERVEFETVPDLGLGLELVGRDQKTAWSIDSYLTSFEDRLTEFAEKKSPALPT
jgi:F-type H+-transporting ATPase subunit b